MIHTQERVKNKHGEYRGSGKSYAVYYHPARRRKFKE
jgi:hypothetical protein